MHDLNVDKALWWNFWAVARTSAPSEWSPPSPSIFHQYWTISFVLLAARLGYVYHWKVSSLIVVGEMIILWAPSSSLQAIHSKKADHSPVVDNNGLTIGLVRKPLCHHEGIFHVTLCSTIVPDGLCRKCDLLDSL